MSGLYLPGMEMPKSCLACEWCVHTIPADNYICYRLNRAVIGVAEEDVNETVNVCCPLIPVPEHGRLIDADEIPYNKIMLEDDDFYYGVTKPYIDRMPTIIPAAEGEG